MQAEMKIHPPHPIPYPDKPFIRKLYRIPILLYRLGLGKLIGKHILIISTIGRKSGKVRRTPIEYHQKGDLIYAISVFEQDPDWYRNLLARPYVTLQNDQGTRQVFARRPESEAEWEGALEYLTKSTVSVLSITDVINHLADPEVQEQVRKWPVVLFEPTDQPCPEPLEVDLLWAWPLILLSLALRITLRWLRPRKKRK